MIEAETQITITEVPPNETKPNQVKSDTSFLLRTARCDSTYDDGKENVSPSKFPSNLQVLKSRTGTKKTLQGGTFNGRLENAASPSSMSDLFESLTVNEREKENAPTEEALQDNVLIKDYPEPSVAPRLQQKQRKTGLIRSGTEPVNLFGGIKPKSLFSPPEPAPRVLGFFLTNPQPVEAEPSIQESSEPPSVPIPPPLPSSPDNLTNDTNVESRVKTVAPKLKVTSPTPLFASSPGGSLQVKLRNTPPLMRQAVQRHLPSPLIRPETDPIPSKVNKQPISPPTHFPLKNLEAPVCVQLPTLQNTSHPDLNSISVETLAALVSQNSKYSDLYAKIFVLDCRFGYEYEGGHIRTAVNFPHDDLFEPFFIKDQTYQNSGKRLCLIFHCEFSSHRAPKAYKKLRSLDRKMNSYPTLYYPEMYLLEGGYKKFWECYPELCEPRAYVEMKDPRFVKEMRISMRVHSKVKRRYYSRSCTDVFAPRPDSDSDDEEQTKTGDV